MDCSLGSFFFPSSFCCLLLWVADHLMLWLSYVLCLACFFIFICVTIIVTWFVVPLIVGYTHLYMCRIVSACWSLNFKCIFNILHLTSPFLMLASLEIFVNEWFPNFKLSLPLPVSFSFSILFSNCGFAFSASGSSFSNCRVGLEVLNSLSFYLSIKLLISPSNLNESFAGYSWF